MGLNKYGLRLLEERRKKIGLDGILSERTASSLTKACDRIMRYTRTHNDPGIAPIKVEACSGDHTLFHRTKSVEDTVAILEKGFAPKRDHFKPGIADYLPGVFFSGHMITLGDYGNIVLVTHTQALKEADRLVVRPSEQYLRERELAEHLYAPSLSDREKKYQELLQPIFDELNEQRKAGKIDDYEESRLLEERVRPYQSIARGIERDSKRARVLYGILRGLRLAPTPCQYLEKMEELTANGAQVAARDVDMVTLIRRNMMDEDAEHILLGFDNDYIMPSEGIGVGLVSRDVEKDPLANELARRNVQFRVVSSAERDGWIFERNEPRLLTHHDFPKQGKNNYELAIT